MEDLDRATLTPRELQIAEAADAAVGVTPQDDDLRGVISRDLGTALARILGAQPCFLCGQLEREHADPNTCPIPIGGSVTGLRN